MSMNRIIGAVMSLYHDAQVGEDAWNWSRGQTTLTLASTLAESRRELTQPGCGEIELDEYELEQIEEIERRVRLANTAWISAPPPACCGALDLHACDPLPLSD